MSGIEQRLRQGLEGAVVDVTPPADPVAWVRSRVARDRRRRVIGAVVAGVALTGAVALAVPSLAGGEDRLTGSVADRPPAPAPTPADDVFSLQPDPFLTEADLARLDGSSTPDVRRVGSTRQALLECMRPGSEPGVDRRVAAFEEPSTAGWINEFVVRYDDADAAHAAIDELERQYADCPWQADETEQPGRVKHMDPSSPYYEPLMDESFGAQRSLAVSGQGTANVYTLAVARDGNVVVVLEFTGYRDRVGVALVKALNRAIGNQDGRCDKDDKFKRQNLSFTPSGFAKFQSFERGCT